MSQSYNILIIEDDNHKLEKILHEIKTYDNVYIEVTNNVQDAILKIGEKSNFYNAYIIDNSLPSHPSKQGSAPAINMSSGGVEILMELYCLGVFSKFIFMLTQYTHIEIEYDSFEHKDAEKKLKEYLFFSNLIVSDYNDNNWVNDLSRGLKNENINLRR